MYGHKIQHFKIKQAVTNSMKFTGFFKFNTAWTRTEDVSSLSLIKQEMN